MGKLISAEFIQLCKDYQNGSEAKEQADSIYHASVLARWYSCFTQQKSAPVYIPFDQGASAWLKILFHFAPVKAMRIYAHKQI